MTDITNPTNYLAWINAGQPYRSVLNSEVLAALYRSQVASAKQISSFDDIIYPCIEYRDATVLDTSDPYKSGKYYIIKVIQMASGNHFLVEKSTSGSNTEETDKIITIKFSNKGPTYIPSSDVQIKNYFEDIKGLIVINLTKSKKSNSVVTSPHSGISYEFVNNITSDIGNLNFSCQLEFPADLTDYSRAFNFEYQKQPMASMQIIVDKKETAASSKYKTLVEFDNFTLSDKKVWFAVKAKKYDRMVTT